MAKEERVAVLGASDKPERYSNKAVIMLKEYGHKVIPVHPALSEVEGCPALPDLASIKNHIDTLTIYLNPAQSMKLINDMLQLNPKRIILNPGTESDELEKRLMQAGIKVEKACTLVLLRTGQF